MTERIDRDQSSIPNCTPAVQMRGRVTGILASYNQAHYVEIAVRSLLAQSRPFDELLVIDDASSDNSVEVASAMLESCPAARLHVNDANRGVAHVNNFGLSIASGDYIGFFASDDVYHQDLVARLADALDRNPSAALACGYDMWIDEDGNALPQLRRVQPKSDEFYSSKEARMYLERYGSFLSGCACLYRTQLLREFGGFDAEFGPFQDGVAREILATRHGMCFIPRVLGYWRRSAQSFSATQGRSSERMLLTIDALERKLCAANDVDAKSKSACYRRRLLDRCRYFALSSLLGQEALSTTVVARIVGDRYRWVARTVALLSRFRRPIQLLLAIILVPRELLGDVRALLQQQVSRR